MKKLVTVLLAALLVVLTAGALSAQGPSPTPGGLGGFFGDVLGTATPTSSSLSNSTSGTAKAPTPNPIAQTLAKDNYVVVTSGNWYDAQGKLANDSVYVMMLGASPDPKSNDSVKQITSGLSALITAYPNAATYHVLLLNGPYVYNASTTSKTLQLLNSKLLSPETFLSDLLAQIRTTNLASGETSGTTAGATATKPSAAATATRVPTRRPTTASSCNPPPGQGRLLVKNGYSGVMRFTVGGGEWGTHDYDIPADGQFHFVDMPPSDKYTYSASIPGVGKASAKLGAIAAGECRTLTFQP